MGFKLEKSGDIGYSFSYEGMELLYLPDDEDEEFFSIALPCICKYKEDNVSMVAALMEKINSSLKYVKAYTLAGSVWLFYERELISEEEDLTPVISSMIYSLERGIACAHKLMSVMEKSIAEGTTDERDAEGIDDERTGNDNNSFFLQMCRRFFKNLYEDASDEICAEDVGDEKTNDKNSNK